MHSIINIALQIIEHISDFINREAQSDEKIKDTSIKSHRDYKKAMRYARQIFDGTRRFRGLDLLLETALSPDDYKEYLKLRQKFNKFS